MHSITPVLRRIALRQPGAARDPSAWLEADESEALWSAVLDGAVPELELGALLATLSFAGESADELLGLHRALSARCARMRPALARPPVSVPVYGFFPAEASFATMLALFLRRFDVPVLVHGPLDAPAGPSVAALLREFGVMPSATIADAERDLSGAGIAFLPAPLLSPAFAELLALRARLSAPNAAHRVAQALDPGGIGAVRLAMAAPGQFGDRIAPLLHATEGESLLLTWPAGVTPGHAVRPRISRISGGFEETVFEAESAERLAGPDTLPEGDRLSWIHAVIERRTPAPMPLVNLAAACVHATGAAPDLMQAKAIVALHAGRMAA